MAQISLNKSSWLNMTSLLEFKGAIFWDQTEYPDIPFDNADTYLQLTDLQAKRMDRVAFNQYGDSELIWVILQANDRDLPNEFIGGETIRLPARTTIDRLLQKKT